MRQKRAIAIVVVGVSSLALVRAVWAQPGYDIYPIPAGNGGYATLGNGISQNGTWAGGTYEGAGAYDNGVLYNISAGTSTFETQTGIIEPGTRSTQEYTGVPAAVNNNGIMFGSSGAGSTVETGAPTVWANGNAAALPGPIGAVGGQVYGANNLNQAVGSVKLSSAGEDNAAIFFYNAANPSSSYGAVLTGAQTTNGGTLQDAFGINDSDVIVGVANDPNNAALTVPFIYNLGAGATSAMVMPNSSSKFNAGIPFAISNSGLVTGSEEYNSGSGDPFIYNMSSGITTSIPLAPNTSGGGGRGINDNGEIVGTDGGLYAVPFLYDGTNSYDLQNLLVNNSSGLWHLDDNTSSGAYSIADNGDIVGRGMYNGVLTAFVMVPTGSDIASAQSLTWNNAGGTGDGKTWDTTSPNWNNGSGTTTFSSASGDNVTFNDANNGNYNVSIPVTVTPSSVIFNNSAGNYVVSGAGGIGTSGNGIGTFVKEGTGTLTLNTVNTYTGPTSIYGGTVILGVPGALPSNTALTISGATNLSATVIIPSTGTPYAITVGSLDAYANGTLNIMNNAVITQTGYLSSITGELKAGFSNGAWNGYANGPDSYPPGISYSGIISSMAGASYPLMAIGAIINDNGSGTPLYGTGGTIATTFDGATPTDGEILIKYTYYGDANLDGKVDGSDYTRIDAAYLADSAYLSANPTGTAQPSTGWYNGDFNYDGVINGSDYTLIDNAFNMQGAAILSEVASVTTEIAGGPLTSAVPEPGSLSLLGVASISLLRRRRRA